MKLWSFLGGPGSVTYGVFDRVRQRLNRKLVAYLRAVSLDGARSRVLEAGSGPGFASFLFSLDERVALSVALDIDHEALQMLGQRKARVAAVGGDLYRLPFGGGSFDLVWNSSTLEHLDRPGDALAEMTRVTRPGGFVFVGVPYRRGPLGVQRLMAGTRLGIWIGPVFGEADVAELVARAGLEPVGMRHYFLRFFIGILARRPVAVESRMSDARTADGREAA